jgi:predicted Zn-ribbon and HTH transcriptional regulator
MQNQTKLIPLTYRQMQHSCAPLWEKKVIAYVSVVDKIKKKKKKKIIVSPARKKKNLRKTKIIII